MRFPLSPIRHNRKPFTLSIAMRLSMERKNSGHQSPWCLEAKGGGGTDFRPVFEWVEARGMSPVCLIYLTDLCCNAYPNPPSYPVLWVTDSRRHAPFGETVKITVD